MCKLCNSDEEIISIHLNVTKQETKEFLLIVKEYTREYPCQKCRRAFREYKRCTYNLNKELDTEKYIVKRLKFFHQSTGKPNMGKPRVKNAQYISNNKYYKNKANQKEKL